MRIIKNPNPVKETVHICEKCQYEFAYNATDIQTESYRNNILGPGHYGYHIEWVTCPNCGEKYIISDSRKNTHSYILPYDESAIIKQPIEVSSIQDIIDKFDTKD